MKLELADIATNEKRKLQGMKVMGVFPFYLRYITTGTHIKLCAIKEQVSQIAPEAISINDFFSSKRQKEVIPLINTYCVTALVNGRSFGWFYRFLLNRKIKQCGHRHLLNLFLTIHQLNEPAFFLAYWKLIKSKESTLLKEEKQF